MNTLDLLRALSEAPGPAGHEERIREVVEELWRPLVDDLRVDAMGSLIGYQKGNQQEQEPEKRKAIMAAAHMDEIGLIVTGIEGEFLRVHSLGGVDRRALLGLEVTVYGRREMPGVIGSRPPHVLPASERQTIPPWHELFVDLGLPAEEVKQAVRVGDHITVRQSLAALKNDLAAGKAMDNRASVAAVTLALEGLHRREHSWDVYAVATVQEEVGIKGAITSAYGIAPDLAVALDVTFAKQYDDSDPGTFSLDKGPTIGIGPNFHPQVVARLRQVAETGEIPFVIEPLPGSSGTDAWGIQLAREGIPTGLISIPVRYMHQPVETVAVRDIDRAGRLLTEFVAGLDVDFHPRWEDEL
ncbi:MAG: M20/M25/M40 family metallo-hydrolase [Anaerolineae bacterium]